MRSTLSTSLLCASIVLGASAIANDVPPAPESSTLPSGLKIEYKHRVACSRASRNGDKIHVAYSGSLTNGVEFENSYDGDPFAFTLGAHQVIKGWDQGLQDMCIGDIRTLTIPAPLAYGHRGAGGQIPPDATLIFKTELMAIDGVKAELMEVHGSELSPTNATTTIVQPDLSSAEGRPPPPPDHGPDGEPSECRLLGPFAILIQGALGALAMGVLVLKRYRERPRRPVKIWFFDVSKQIAGSVLLHLANLFMSMLSSGDLDVRKVTSFVAIESQNGQPNPCSFYLLNLAIDTTIGIPILVLLLRIVHGLAYYTPLANPPESLKSGHYGNPAHASWWAKQSVLYFFSLICMKACVFLVFSLFPWLGWVGDWALRWTEGKEWMQILFVMLVFPLIMNALQYWIIDSFIKDRSGGWEEYQQVGGSEDEDYEGSGLIGAQGRRHSIEHADGSFDDEGSEAGKEGASATLSEVNPTPIPMYAEDSSSGSSGNTKKNKRRDKDN